MKKLNNKGYMLVEIILAFVIMFGLIYFLMDLVINLKNKNDDLVVDTIVKTDQTIISNKLMEHIIEDTSDGENIKFSCDNIDVDGNAIKYNNNIIGIVDDIASISYEKGKEKYCYNKNGKIHINIPVEIKQMPDKNYDIVVDYRYKLMHCNPLKSYRCANGSVGSEPYTFTYTGNCKVVSDGDNGDWKINFLTSGTFSSECEMLIDAFLVGGGGGGGAGYYIAGGGGGGGGLANTGIVKIKSGINYKIKVGAGGLAGQSYSVAGQGGTTSAFGMSAAGGEGGGKTSGDAGGIGGNGGSGGGGGGSCRDLGGNGGINGVSGDIGTGTSGVGSLRTTREFGETAGKLYSGGGGGGGGRCKCEVSYTSGGSSCYYDAGTGGDGGGGAGGKENVGANGIVNTGGGGGGGAAYSAGGTGGSGVVVIRNARNVDEIKVNFDYENGDYIYIDDGTGNWKIKFLTSGIFIPYDDLIVDAFLVGGGGGGGSGFSVSGGGGGGGGYTQNSVVTLKHGQSYNVVIGAGGNGGSSTIVGGQGGTTSAFGINALGGNGGGSITDGLGGNGGSGGGAGASCGKKGGAGGSNGENGVSDVYTGGLGQGFSTKEFNYGTGDLYSGGGAGGGSRCGDASSGSYYYGGIGGIGGGGGGGRQSVGGNGLINTGGGGGGGAAYNAGGNGGSGIVIIRKKDRNIID